MEVTCQLRRDQLTQAGLAQVQVTCCWDGQRTKFGTGLKCLLKHWDTVKEKPTPLPTKKGRATRHDPFQTRTQREFPPSAGPWLQPVG
ncbi:MAG: Arm DNA-binding domain-containing protein [Janthinobacterium lividum]